MSNFPELAEALCCKQSRQLHSSKYFLPRLSTLSVPEIQFTSSSLTSVLCLCVRTNVSAVLQTEATTSAASSANTLHVNTAIYWAKVTVPPWFYKQSLIHYIVHHPFLDTGKYLYRPEEEKRGLQHSTVMHCIVLYDTVL